METKEILWTGPVDKEWVDYNGHMNDAAYAKAFSIAVDTLMDKLGIDSHFRAENRYTIFTLETHLIYLDEAHAGQELSVSVQLLDQDEKRLHVFFEMSDTYENRIATSEQMLMGMDTKEGKPSPFPSTITNAVLELAESQRDLPMPREAGRTIGIRKK